MKHWVFAKHSNGITLRAPTAENNGIPAVRLLSETREEYHTLASEVICKIAVRVPSKQSEMRWSKQDIEHVLRIYCVLADNSFDAA